MTDIVGNLERPVVEWHPKIGCSLPSLGWIPAPRYLLRRDCILTIMRDMVPGRLLEIGCGAGCLLHDLTAMGFRCTGIETSPSALRLAWEIARYEPTVEIEETLQLVWQNKPFDYIASFEVLEHIENDAAALDEWRSYLKPGGYLLVGVPCHMSRWSSSDVWAGHFRRYERQDLEALLKQTGFVVEHVDCYGFPLSNMIDPIRAAVHRAYMAKRGGQEKAQENIADQTAQSGSDRAFELRFYPILKSILGLGVMQAAYVIQRRYLHKEWGTGYLALCRKV